MTERKSNKKKTKPEEQQTTENNKKTEQKIKTPDKVQRLLGGLLRLDMMDKEVQHKAEATMLKIMASCNEDIWADCFSDFSLLFQQIGVRCEEEDNKRQSAGKWAPEYTPEYKAAKQLASRIKWSLLEHGCLPRLITLMTHGHDPGAIYAVDTLLALCNSPKRCRKMFLDRDIKDMIRPLVSMATNPIKTTNVARKLRVWSISLLAEVVRAGTVPRKSLFAANVPEDLFKALGPPTDEMPNPLIYGNELSALMTAFYCELVRSTDDKELLKRTSPAASWFRDQVSIMPIPKDCVFCNKCSVPVFFEPKHVAKQLSMDDPSLPEEHRYLTRMLSSTFYLMTALWRVHGEDWLTHFNPNRAFRKQIRKIVKMHPQAHAVYCRVYVFAHLIDQALLGGESEFECVALSEYVDPEKQRWCSRFGCQNQENKTKFQRCQGCLLACYCSAECQKQHWPTHKQGCKLNAKRGFGKFIQSTLQKPNINTDSTETGSNILCSDNEARHTIVQAPEVIVGKPLS